MLRSTLSKYSWTLGLEILRPGFLDPEILTLTGQSTFGFKNIEYHIDSSRLWYIRVGGLRRTGGGGVL